MTETFYLECVKHKFGLYFRIRVLLHRTRRDFEDTCDLCTGVSRCDPTYINMPWTDLIMACVEFKITEADFMDPNSEVLCDF